MKNGDIVFIKETAGQNMGWRNKTVGIISPFADDTIKDILSKSYGSLAMEHLSLAVESGTFDELKLVARCLMNLLIMT